MDDYLREFVQESEETITELNNALLELEQRPDDEETMDRVFRMAHTLKGNCGAMGFDDASDLAHAMEDRLEDVRAGRLDVSPELMDAVFDGVDALEEAIREVRQHGEPTSDVTDAVRTLRSMGPGDGDLVPPTGDEIDDAIEGADDPGPEHAVYHVRLDVEEAESVNNAVLVVEALEDAFDLLGTEPPESELRSGEDDGTVDAVFGSAVEEAAIEAALDPVDEVHGSIVTEVTDRARSDPDPADGRGGIDLDAGSGVDAADAADMEVDELLSEFEEYDDLDALVEQMDGADDIGELGEAGSFDDLDIEADDIEAPDPLDESAGESASAGDADDFDLESGGGALGGEGAAETDADDADDVPADGEEVEDAAETFAELKDEVDEVGFDELQDELADLEFDQYDQDEEVGFDELLTEDELEGDDFGGRALADDEEIDDAIDDILVDDAGVADHEGSPATADTSDAAAGGDAGDAAEAEPPGFEDAEEEITFGEADGGAAETAAADAEPGDTAAADDAESLDFESFASGGASGDGETSTEDAPSQAGAKDTFADDVFPGDPDAESPGDEATAAADAADADSAAAPAVTPGDDPEPAVAPAADPTPAVGPAPTADETDTEPAVVPGDDPEPAIVRVLSAADETDADETEPAVSPGTDPTPAVTPAPATDPGRTETPATPETPEASGAPETPDVDVGVADDADFGDEDIDVSFADDGSVIPDADAEEPASPPEESFAATDAPEPEADDGFGDVADPSVEVGGDDVDFGGDDLDVSFADHEAESAADRDDEAPADDFGDFSDEVGPEFEDDAVEADFDDDFEAGTEGLDGAAFGEADDEFDEIRFSDSGTEAETATADAAAEASGVDVDEFDGDDLPGTGLDRDSLGGEDALDDDALGLDRDSPLSSFESELGAGADDAAADAEPEPSGPDLPDRDVDLDALLPTPPRRAAAEGDDDEMASIRVDIGQVDDLMNLVEGLVTQRARLRRAVETGESLATIDEELDDVEELTSELQDAVMDIRLVPLRSTANRLPRVVRDVAREQGKQVDFEMAGADVELDRSVLDDISDPLMHVVRNAVDHGIERPEDREAVDKDPTGTVELRAERQRDTVVIEVEDDGCGLDADELRERAVAEDRLTEAEAEGMDDETAYDLIFDAGFSTAEEVTEVSGRGVGMDVVASTVADLEGEVEVESNPGEGTTVRMRLPVSVAISDVLFVEAGGEEYGVPLKAVEEIDRMGAVEERDGEEHLVVGDEDYPLVRLADRLDAPEPGSDTGGMVVRIRTGVRRIAVHCDEVRGQQEVVVKPFEGVLGDVPGLTGAAVLGEGEVVNILDVNTL